jgi:hypothetical protein
MGVFRKGLPRYVLGVTTLACVGVLALSSGGVAAAAPVTPGSPSALAAAKWSAIPPGPLSLRVNQISLWTGSNFLIWGGITEPTQAKCPCPQHALDDGAMFNPQSKKWVTMSKSPLAPRGYASAIWTGHEALNVPQFTKPIDIFNLATHQWTMSPNNPVFVNPIPATSIGSAIVVINASGGIAFNPATNKVTPLAPPPKGDVVGPFSIGWTGQSVLLWGAGLSTKPLALQLSIT